MLLQIVVLPEVLDFTRQQERGRLEAVSRAFSAIETAWSAVLLAKLRTIPGLQALFEPVVPLEVEDSQ